MRVGRDALQQTLDIGNINAYTPESFTQLLLTLGLDLVRPELFDHRPRAMPLAAHASRRT
jgi:hypothetical protein